MEADITEIRVYWSLQHLSNAIFAIKFLFWALHKYVLYKGFTLHSEGLSKICLSQNTVATICK